MREDPLCRADLLPGRQKSSCANGESDNTATDTSFYEKQERL